MSHAWTSALLRLGAWLVAGALIGAYFGSVPIGMLVAALTTLGFHLFALFRLERELRLRQKLTVPDGTGIWAQVLARIAFLNQRIDRNKSRYRALLKEIRASTNALPDGVILIDDLDQIVRYNKAAQKLLGFKKRRDRGQRIDNLLRHPEFVRYLQRREYADSVVLPSPRGEGDWLRCKIVSYGPGLRIALFRDITEQTRLARMRRDFVANASHELRSPLTVISGYLDALSEDETAPPHWQRPIHEMRTQADRMRAIIADLLELSRLESGLRPVQERSIDIPTMLSLAVEEAQRTADVPELRLELGSRRQLVGNSAEIQTVVSNLLQNAIRHTPSSGTVTLGWQDLEGGGAELYVHDTGEGIAEPDISRLTERFFRVNRGRSRGDGGVGLGLAIVKHALGRHDAKLKISSTPGVGSRFSCRFLESHLRDPPS